MTGRSSQDRELIRRYLAGDADAFEALMAAHEGRVFSICLRMLRNRDSALDATQDVFLTVFRKVDRYKEQAAFSTWLYRVTVNTCYDHLRREKRKRTDAMPDHLDPPDPRSEDAIGAVELRPDIERALQTIAPEFRAAAILVDIEGLSLQGAADILGVPIGTVKSRVFRARRQLAIELGNLAPPPRHPKEEP
ncbi:MAG: RNA polymerase sigma factor SigM [Acidimicrobiia bacterium]|nr:MAG: RNA polymerase sigma factor SigM [Acidimicrobiia bacterium]